jgi:hypothetical protein
MEFCLETTLHTAYFATECLVIEFTIHLQLYNVVIELYIYIYIYVNFSFILQVAMFVVPAANIPLVLFSGFFLNLRDVPSWLKWLTHISYFRYAFEGSMQCVYGYNRSNMECSQPYCYFKSPLKFLEEFEMADAVYAYDIGALVIWVVVLQLLVLIVLKARIRSLQ